MQVVQDDEEDREVVHFHQDLLRLQLRCFQERSRNQSLKLYQDTGSDREGEGEGLRYGKETRNIKKKARACGGRLTEREIFYVQMGKNKQETTTDKHKGRQGQKDRAEKKQLLLLLLFIYLKLT